MSSPEGTSESRLPLDDQRSVSDGDLDSERKRRRSRRRRGNRGRYKPYDLASDLVDEASTSAASPSDKKPKNRKGGQPMAPRNTTQFLLHDMEERAEAEREVELAHCAEGRRRVRSLSVGSELLYPAYTSDGESDTSSLSDANHREFETELEEFNIERISHLTRDEMAREIMDKDKEAEVYHDGLLRVNRENERLRKLLKDNGIPIENQSKTSPCQPQAVS